MKHLILTASLAAILAAPAHAGGPVIAEEPEPAPVVRDRNNALPLILLGVVVAAMIAGGGSSDCLSEEPTQPAPGGC